MPLPDPATRTIVYRPDLGILIVRWNQDAELAVLQADYHAMLAAAEQHNCARWLLDVRRREGTDPELSAWASTVFYPLAATRLAPQHLQLAVLTSSYIYERFNQDPTQRPYVDYMLATERPFVTQVFADEGQAARWLMAS
ncbi:hypothetical protein [Hymenobacter sp. BT491]|uniref:hypothetical protein n=1 Tax=Hymenobacter sp. BT491 TaxID=2766779 RepID=UPI001653D64D|nr:hypothetical protein [Hymenobacter sp. BT491]MBC6988666.1 hypothetical protein [Hymenobacter sp. BT491]